MTCRHRPGDPDCSSSPQGQERIAAERDRSAASESSKRESELRRQIAAMTADPTNYSIEQVERVGTHLVMRVRYPSCTACEFEGSKVMVFLNVGELEAIRWKRIDPHFRAPGKKSETDAPSPAARFPATADGWCDAVTYARGKS